ncbi:MAG: hypothetical protein ACJAS1_007486 [Oleiphilaceae bacterium]|jgi:hypothetical protein
MKLSKSKISKVIVNIDNSGSIPMATFSHLLFKSLGKMLRGGWAKFFKKSQQGTAVGFLLVWCGQNAKH